MVYSKGLVQDVLDFLDAGHSTREAQRRFDVHFTTAARWRRERDALCRTGSPQPVECLPGIVRMALGMAYGNHGFKLDQVACTLGVAASTISAWKKRYLEGGNMEIPEIDPEEIEQMRTKDIEDMSEEELKSYIHKLEVKAYALEGTVRILKAEGIEGLSNDENAQLIDARPKGITATEMLEALHFSSSSYYYCRSKPDRSDDYADARCAIREEFELVGRSRGYRYLRQRLREREEPICISGKKVRSLMAEEGCVVAYARKRRGYSSYDGEITTAPKNIVNRDFHADLPNELWLTDVAQFALPAGKVYLSPIIDCFDGMPISWTIRKSPNAEMANTMLKDACDTLSADEAPVIHTDRGCHYRWPEWIEICKERGLVRSMSKKGCSPDNSAMEGFFGRLKNEFFYYRDWSGITLDEFISLLDDYMRYYRDQRIKESLGWKSPKQYRKSLGLVA